MGCLSRNRLRTWASLVVLAVAPTACGDSTGPPPVGLIQLLESLLSAEVGTTLVFSVRIDDERGVPIEGLSITFAPTSGAGSVSPSTLVTGPSGVVNVSWTLGTVAGTQTVRVTAGLKSIEVVATATPGAPAEIVVSSGDAQSGPVGVALSAQPSAQVRDQFSNGVPGITVTFTADAGSVTATEVVTDAAGRA